MLKGENRRWRRTGRVLVLSLRRMLGQKFPQREHGFCRNCARDQLRAEFKGKAKAWLLFRDLIGFLHSIFHEAKKCQSEIVCLQMALIFLFLLLYYFYHS